MKIKLEIFCLFTLFTILLPAVKADTPIPYYAVLVLEGDYTKIPASFKSDAVGVIAVHYGRTTTIQNYNGSNSTNIVINYSVQIGVNGESISDALQYIQTPVAQWLSDGYATPWNNPTRTYPVVLSEEVAVGYTFSAPAATTAAPTPTSSSTDTNVATSTPAASTAAGVTYQSTSATVSVNATFSAVNIISFQAAAQSDLQQVFSPVPYKNITITSIRSGSIITDYVIVYPSQYESQVEDLVKQLSSGRFAGYDVISSDVTGVSRPQTSTPNNEGTSSSNSTGAIVGGVVGGVGGAIAIALIAAFLVHRHKKNKRSKPDLESGAANSSAITLPPASREVAVPMLKNIIVSQELGAGKFGKVYKGVWNHTTPVALKCNAKTEGQDEFYNEMDILLKLNHPNVVRAIGIFKNLNDTYLVMEYLSKGALSDFLRQPEIHNRLTELDLLNMCAHVAAGLHYLEDRNIVHRDLAARNLLVTEVDGRYIIKIADFGLSREVHGVFKSAQAHIPLKWSPPEVIQNNQYSTKSDVWSFAIAAWEIFTYAEAPYTGLSNADAVEAIMKRGLRLERPANCPEQLYEIMLKCWLPDPTKRPSFNFIWQQLTNMIDVRKQTEPDNFTPSIPQVHAYADMPITYVQTSSEVNVDSYARYVRTEDSEGTNHYIRTTESSNLPQTN